LQRAGAGTRPFFMGKYLAMSSIQGAESFWIIDAVPL